MDEQVHLYEFDRVPKHIKNFGEQILRTEAGTGKKIGPEICLRRLSVSDFVKAIDKIPGRQPVDLMGGEPN